MFVCSRIREGPGAYCDKTQVLKLNQFRARVRMPVKVYAEALRCGLRATCIGVRAEAEKGHTLRLRDAKVCHKL